MATYQSPEIKEVFKYIDQKSGQPLFNTALSFVRMNKWPLDVYSLFRNLDEAWNFIGNPDNPCYPGQIISTSNEPGKTGTAIPGSKADGKYRLYVVTKDSTKPNGLGLREFLGTEDAWRIVNYIPNYLNGTESSTRILNSDSSSGPITFAPGNDNISLAWNTNASLKNILRISSSDFKVETKKEATTKFWLTGVRQMLDSSITVNVFDPCIYVTDKAGEMVVPTMNSSVNNVSTAKIFDASIQNLTVENSSIKKVYITDASITNQSVNNQTVKNSSVSKQFVTDQEVTNLDTTNASIDYIYAIDISIGDYSLKQVAEQGPLFYLGMSKIYNPMTENPMVIIENPNESLDNEYYIKSMKFDSSTLQWSDISNSKVIYTQGTNTYTAKGILEYVKSFSIVETENLECVKRFNHDDSSAWYGDIVQSLWPIYVFTDSKKVMYNDITVGIVLCNNKGRCSNIIAIKIVPKCIGMLEDNTYDYKLKPFIY